MVGLVLVSHSRALAQAIVGLVRQVASPDAPIAIAAGVGLDRAEFGTDAVDISEAIQSVYSDDGVLILMDLGSAVLSAEMAVELLPPKMAQKIRFCPAPLVEGAMSAGVQIGLGSSLDQVYNEAAAALAPKNDHLGHLVPQDETAQSDAADSGASLTMTVTLTNLHGLHARPAARFVQTAASFDANIQVTNLTRKKGPVSARSLNAITTLGAIEGHQVRIWASGPQAGQALVALQALVIDNFGEQSADMALSQAAEKAAPTLSQLESGALEAVPVSEGIAIGPFYRYQPPLPPVPKEKAANPLVEWERLERALSITRQSIQQRRQQLRGVISEADAAIFDAHLLILQDPDLLAQVRLRIENKRQNVAAAWHAALSATADSYRALEDVYFRQRAADVEDVRNQVLFALAGRTAAIKIALDQPVILFAQDISPSETSQLDMKRVLAIVTTGGGPTSHSAILARALGIPAVVGVSAVLERTPPGTLVAVDGFKGAVWVEPEKDVQERLQKERAAWLEQRQQLIQASQSLASTRDGRRVEVFANLGRVNEAAAAVQNGAEGVGLLRTEFLFISRQTPPIEDEQLAALRQIGEAMGGRPVVVRTLDVGGDKEVPYVQLQPEANPFLGVRAIRLSLHQPDLFLPQLRAILRAAAEFPFKIMFPMVANLEEVRQARDWMQRAHTQLLAERLTHAWPVETGIMVEIPSAALLSWALAKEVDFFSIGTNDLTQYTLAAERGNPLLSGLADALHPAVLRLVAEVAEAAHAEGKWVGVCGELAGDPLAAPILIGLGVDELSLSPVGIPRIKSIVRSLDSAAARSLAEKALQADGAAQVRQMAQEFNEKLQI